MLSYNSSLTLVTIPSILRERRDVAQSCLSASINSLHIVCDLSSKIVILKISAFYHFRLDKLIFKHNSNSENHTLKIQYAIMNFLQRADSNQYQSGKIDLFVLNKEYLFIIYAILLVFYMQAKENLVQIVEKYLS